MDPGQRIEFDVDALDAGCIAQIVGVGGELVVETDIDVVLGKALAEGRRISGARYAAIGILDASRSRLARFETSGIDEAARRQIGERPQGHGVLGLLIRDPRPIRLDDVGAHPKSFGFPVGHPAMTTFLGVPIRVGPHVWGNFYFCDREDGEPFSRRDEEAITLLAGFVGLAVANAQGHREDAARVVALQRTLGALEATSAISRAVSDEIDIERVLELVVKRGRALVEARATVILLLEGEELVVARTAGELGADLAGARMDVLDTVCGEVLRSGRPRRFDRLAGDAHLGVLSDRDVSALLCAPLYLRGRALGVLAAVDRLDDGPTFSDEDERLMDAFAASAAIAVATSQNVVTEGLRRAIDAAERERSRWALEIHDDTLQELAALKLALSRLRRAEDERERSDALELAQQQVDRAVDGLRGIVTDLRPGALDTLGAEAAIMALADRAARNAGLTVNVVVDLDYESGREEARPTPEIEATIYRVVQEALSNVIRHSGAGLADVEVVESQGVITIRVRDDGRGMAGEVSDQSFGLIGMRERLAFVGGSLRLSSGSGSGTLVEATIPVGRGERVARGLNGAPEGTGG